MEVAEGIKSFIRSELDPSGDGVILVTDMTEILVDISGPTLPITRANVNQLYAAFGRRDAKVIPYNDFIDWLLRGEQTKETRYAKQQPSIKTPPTGECQHESLPALAIASRPNVVTAHQGTKTASPPMTRGHGGIPSARKNVTVVGSGNWGMAIAKVIAGNTIRHPEFADDLTVWMHEEEVQYKGRIRKLSEIFNETKENVKYLPGFTMPDHVRAEPDLKLAVQDADILVWVLPHQFVPRTIGNMGPVKDGCVSVNLIKGGLELDGDRLGLYSDLLRKMLGHEVAVLMGANVANEVAAGDFCEATLGLKDTRHEALLTKLFNCQTFHVHAIDDVPGVELCGALKNVVALAAGFCDGLDYGSNTKAALIRIGLSEMKTFIRFFFPDVKDATFLESCGVADLITTCFGGRNRKCAEAFVRARGMKSWNVIEKELLNGQKLQGTLTAKEIWPIICQHNLRDKLPLLTAIYQISFEDKAPWTIVNLPQGNVKLREADGGEMDTNLMLT